MSGFRIGAPALPAKDVAYIRALVRLFAYTEKLQWSFVDDAPYNALIASSDEPSHPGGSLTLVMLDKIHAPHTIAYPIRADQLREWLKRMAEALLTQAAPAARAPAPAPLPAAAPPAASAATLADSRVDPAARYKLRRWPSPALLRNDPLRIQMATFMTRQHVSTLDLSRLAGNSGTVQAQASATAFVDELMQAGLLLAGPAMAAAAAPAAASRQSGAVGAAETNEAPRGIAGITSGLLGTIRRRMGLQG